MSTRREHPSEDVLRRFVDGAAETVEIDALEDHLDRCASCRAVIAGLARATAAGASGVTVAGTAADTGSTDAMMRALARTPGGGGEPVVTGAVIDEQYRVERPLGQGGMGVVYLARDLRLDRDVALKLGNLVSGTALERIEREAVALARLSHPNVVVVHQVGESGGRLYIAMEYVANGNAREWLAARPRTWREIVALYCAAGDGLASAHAAGLVHRDFKPDNVLVGVDERPRVADFGLVRSDAAPSESRDAEAPAGPVALTQTGAVLGTPAYMAPEQIAGGDVDARADQFAFCVAVWEALYAQRPFRGRTPDEIAAAIESSAPRRSADDRARRVPRRVQAALRRGLAPDRARRWPSMAPLLVELRRALAARRRTITLAAAAGFALVAIAVAIAVAAAVVPRAPSSAGAVAATRTSAGPPFHRCSADRWCWPEDTIITLYDVWGTSSDDLWAVGPRGVIRHFDGRAWSSVDSPVVADLGSVHGSARDDVWAVGDWGTVLHYDGRAWRQIDLGTRAGFGAVWAIARDDAWMTGAEGLVEHWDGARWTPMPTGLTGDLGRVAASGRDDVWFLSKGTIAHWDGVRMTTMASGRTEPTNGLRVFGPHDIWIDGFHSVLVHGDGTHWTSVPLPDFMAPADREDHPFNDVAGSGPDDVWALSKWVGTFLHWDGHTWTQVPTGTQRELQRMFFLSRDDGYAVGDGGTVVHWDGHAWTHLGADRSATAYDGVWGRDADDVWFAESFMQPPAPSYGRVEHWDGHTIRPMPMPLSPPMHAVSGHGDEVWAAGERGAVVRRVGEAFARVDPPTRVRLRGIWRGARETWVTGDDATLFRWDGAWHAIATGASGSLRAVWGADESELWVVGDGGQILRGTGDRFVPVASGTTEPLFAVWGAARDDVWAGGEAGALVHWDGRTWTPVNSDTTEQITAIGGSRSDDAWLGTLTWNTARGALVHWNGQFWTAVSRTPRSDFGAVWSPDPHEAWATGWKTLMHYSFE